jgi:predicted lipase
MNDFTAVSACKECKVHHGFNKCFESVRDAMYSAVTSLALENPDYSLLVAGHSLGGAISLLASLYLEQFKAALGKTPVYYSFGSPKVGNDNFAAYANAHLPQAYRVTHYKDTVPHLPLAWYYHHITTEIYENEAHQLHTCSGEADKNCSQQFALYELSFDYHVLYLSLSMNCAAVS